MITCADPALIGPALRRGELGTLHLQFVPTTRREVGARVLELDMIQLADGEPIGGQRFLRKTTLGRDRPCRDAQLGTFDGVDWQPRQPDGCGRGK